MTDTLKETSRHPTRAILRGFLAAPLIWVGQFLLIYLLAEGVCMGGQISFSLLDTGVVTGAVVVITLMALAAIGVLGSGAYRQWRGLRQDRQAALEAEEGSTFLALSGFLLSAFFALVILLTVLPFLVLRPCGWVGS